MIVFFLILVPWIGIAVLAGALAHRLGTPALLAVAIAGAALSMAAAPLLDLLIRASLPRELPSDARAYHDTYYVVSRLPYQAGLSLAYLTAAGLVWLVLRIAPARVLARTAAMAIWALHLGIGLVIATQIAIARDGSATFDPDRFSAYNTISAIGGFLGMAGLTLLLAAAIVTLARRVLRGRH